MCCPPRCKICLVLSVLLLSMLAAGCGKKAPGGDGDADASAADTVALADVDAVDGRADATDVSGDTAPLDLGDASTGRCPTSAVPGDGLVITEQGAVQGVQAGETWVYRGVPYAAPPVDALRWRPPAEPACFDGVYDASEFGASCLRAQMNGDVPGSEDCLFLNVWAPLEAPATPRAVMVYLHGGGNQVGSSAEPGDGEDLLFNGRVFVEAEEVVFVTLNYRLGALGFLTHPALSAESAEGVSGNYGLLDQVAALEWVRRNIAAFGGDPDRVMVFGESAGAFDVCALMASPLAEGLFHRALMESGNCQVPALAQRAVVHEAFMAGLGCDGASDAACLRGVDPVLIVETQGPLRVTTSLDLDDLLPWGPAVDGWVLEESPHEAFAGGRQADVPFVIGSNADEMTFFLLLENISQADFLGLIDAIFGPGQQAAIQTFYDRMGLEAWRRPAIELTTDVYFTCEARRIARWAAASGSAPAYRYYLTWFVDNAVGRPAGSAHGIELPLLFQKTSIGPYTLMADELDLGAAMLRYWARFAITGDPNGGMDPVWPAYDGTTGDAYMQLDTPPAAGDGVDSAECDLIDQLLGF